KARYIGPDGRERSKTFARKVEAERFLATVDADLVRGEWIDPRLGQKTFRQWVEEFESSRVDLEATTQAQHAACLRNHLLPWFGGSRVGELAGLRPHRIQVLRGRLEVVEALKETGQGHYFGPPKYGRVRSVPLPPFLVEELAGYLGKFPPVHDLVFTSPE